jgi:hypothetical protein
MSPPAERGFQLKVLLSDREKRMLDDLTEHEGISASELIRGTLRTNHASTFKTGFPGETPPTVRGILTDCTPPPHFTAGNIAKRTQLTLYKVLETLKRLADMGMLVQIDDQGANSTWQPKGPMLEKTLAIAEKRGFELDVDLRD